jgi:hypothetical protein
MPPKKAGIQYSEALMIDLERRGVLDRPPKPVIGRRFAPTRRRTMTTYWKSHTGSS